MVRREQRYAFGSAQTVANFDVSPDGERFVMVKDDSASGRINVVLNWVEELNGLCRRTDFSVGLPNAEDVD